MKRTTRGFTLVELLVTMAIIGTLLAISVLILGQSRAKGRDAKRVSDVQVIRAALEQSWVERAAYPTAASWTNLGTGSATVMDSNGLEASPGSGRIYLSPLPTGPNTSEYYQYMSASGATGYAIRFTTERQTNYGPAGTYYAHSIGVDTDSSQK
jgi:prepilin-type N-terminal cleavage/methylation domain-containing protein